MSNSLSKNATSREGLSGAQSVHISVLNKHNINTIVESSNNRVTDPRSCRRFESCNAPQCPLDLPSLESPHYSGEAICFWLSGYAKGNLAKLKSAMGDVPFDLVAEAYFKLRATHGTIRNRLDRAKTTPSRLRPSGGAR